MLFRDRVRDKVIVCPHCGEEYLPAEIFIPNAFFGKPENIDRTASGQIEVFDGTTMDLSEEYKCDKCGNVFYVEADVKFTTRDRKTEQLDEVYTSKLRPDKVSLFEDFGEQS